MANIETFKYPRQRLSFNKKIENDKQWGKDMLDNLILNYASYHDGYSSSSQGAYADEYFRKLSNYQLYNNILNQKDFERECNPLGIDVGQFKDEIQPYNKTYNKLQVLLGEELKRPLNYKTILVNSEGIKTKQLERTQALKQLINQHIQKALQLIQSSSDDPAMIQQALESSIDQKTLKKYSNQSFLSSKERLANQILQYLIYSNSIKEKMVDGFKHGLIAGDEYTWVGIRNNESVIDVLNSLGVFHHKSPETKYVQYGLYAGYRTMMSVGDILDTFENLSSDDIERIEGTLQGVTGMRGDIVGPTMKYYHDDVYHKYERQFYNSYDREGSYGPSSYGEDWLVTHAEWRSEKKVYILTFTNEYQDEEKTIVNESFKIPDYADKTYRTSLYGDKKTIYTFDNYTAELTWISEIWEGVRIGEEMYTNIGPKPYQLRDIDNPNKVKLGYHGVVYNAMNAAPISLMDRMKPFQYLYLIVAHKLKKLIARDKGQVFHLDLSMVPEKLGLEKTLYYLEEMDIDFFNPLQNAESPGAYQRGKVTSATNRSNMQHITNYLQILEALDQQISDVAGVTRQREGQTAPAEAVTNVQQNILQSSTITEAAYFQPHYKLWEETLTSAIDITQQCWKNKSLTKQYVLDDLSLQTLQVSPDDLTNASFGVYLSSSSKDSELFELLKTLPQALVQNDKATFSDLIRAYKATSIAQLEEQIESSESEALQRLQEQQQQAMQLQREQSLAQQQSEEAQRQHEINLELMKQEHELRLKELELLVKKDDKAIPDIEIKKIEEEINIKKEKLDIERKKLKQQKELEEKKINVQKSKARSSK